VEEVIEVVAPPAIPQFIRPFLGSFANSSFVDISVFLPALEK
jgi:hypothetical protein